MTSLLTPKMIRTFMLDRSADENFLLDEVEMDSESIDLAMMMTVERYNGLPPILDSHQVCTFPYRYELLIGVVGHLLRSKSLSLVRNALPFTSSSGVAVDDKDAKGRRYEEIGSRYLADFDARCRGLKQNENINAGYGWIGGP